jgi:hypothetical protein
MQQRCRVGRWNLFNDFSMRKRLVLHKTRSGFHKRKMCNRGRMYQHERLLEWSDVCE